MNRYIIIISFFLFFSVHSFSQSCKNELLKLEEKINNKKKVEKNKIQFFDIDVINKFENKTGTETKRMNIKMYMSFDIVHYESDFISVYLDNNDFFLVLHEEKTVFKKKSNRKVAEDDLLKTFNNYAESFKLLIEKAESITCRTFHFNETTDLKMFVVKPKSEKFDKIETVKYYYDINKERLYKIVTDFKNNKPLIQQKTIYKTVNSDYKKKKLKPAEKMIYDLSGKLLSKYKNYTLINE